MALTDQAGVDFQERLIRAEIEARETERIRAEAARRAAADQDWAEREAARRVASEDAHFAAEAQRAEEFHSGGKPAPAADTDAKAAESKAQPDAKAETPKPDTPKPSPKPDTATAAAGDGKRVWNAGRIGTQMGVPPSAVRNLRAGEPVAGLKGIAKAQWGAGQHWAGKAGTKLGAKLADKGLQGLGKAGLKGAARLLPVVGSIYAGYNAWRDFKSGDYVGAALNLLGVIPGPVGWVALGAATIWDLTGWGHRYGEWDKPDGTSTFMLQGSAKDVAGVTGLDAELRAAQAGVFSFQDGPTGTVWDSTPPAAIRLDTAEIKAAATAWLTGISDHFAAIDKVMVNAGEQYFTEQRAALAPHLTAMAALKAQIPTLLDQLAAASDGAKTGYSGVLQANKAARQQLSSDGTLSDQGPATSMKTAVQTGSAAIKAANDKLTKLFAETPPPVVAARTGSPGATRPAEKPQTPAVPATAPAATPPAVTTAPQTPTTPAKDTKANDDLSKLLSQLGQQTKAPVSTPTSNPLGNTGTGGLGGGSPLGSQGLGGGRGGGTPLSQSKPDTSTKEEPKKLVDDKPTERKTAEPKKLSDDKSLTAPKPENAKAAVPAAQTPAAAPVAPAAAQSGLTPAQQNAAHAAQAAEPSKEVDVKGTKTTFPDAKTAKLAEILSKADPTHPMSLADAAKSAGLTPPTPGQDPGKQVSPADAKPGDLLVAGGQNYMLLGDGKFYDLSDYKVVSASEIPQQLGDRAGYFHLNDPAPGQPAGQGVPGPQAPAAPPQGPVSPQSTAGVSFPVPNATGAPAGPADASPAPAAPAGVPSVGAPNVPKPAPAGAGPANAAATDTGVGVGGPSTGGKPLDPGAVR